MFGLLVFLLCSCGGTRGRTDYSLGFYNNTNVMIDNESIKFGDVSTVGGVVVSKGVKVNFYLPRPTPGRVTVVYDLSDGKTVSKEINLRQRVPAEFIGIIFFTLNPDLTLTFETYTYDDYFSGKGPSGNVNPKQ
jgi:hypothetical protein